MRPTTVTTAVSVSPHYETVTTLATSTNPSPRLLYHHDPSTLSARYTVSKQSTAYASGSDASPTRWEMGAWSDVNFYRK